MSKARAIISALLPLLVLGGWVVYLSAVGTWGRTVSLSVKGYDPRDLLSGHYLTYTVDYGRDVCLEKNRSSSHCVCFENEQSSSVSWAGACDSMPKQRCELYLRGGCSYRGFEAGIERYYIPEKFSTKLSTVPENSRIEVRIDQQGNGFVKDFLVDGEKLLDYANGQ